MLISMMLIVIFQINLQPFGSATISPIVLTTSSAENVTVYFLDVGQGDSILVKTPSKNILIDGGPTVAGTTVLNDLNAYHITKIDLMVATHPHEDHIGGLIAVLQSTMPIQDIIYNGYNYTATQTFNSWKTLALAHNLTQASRNQVYALSHTINFTVLSPTNSLQFSDLNAESIVMKLQVGNTSVL
jgi:competence protein ComEC